MPAKVNALETKLAQSGIVAASAGVFARLGFAAARVEDILDAAGIARRTFYKYFRSKEEVLAALYELATNELLKALRGEGVAPGPLTASAVAFDGDPLDAVRMGLDFYLDYHVDNARLLKVLVEQAIRSDSPLAPARARFREGLVRLLDGAVRAKTGEEHDPMYYQALVSALEGLSLELLATGAAAEDVARAKRVMHLLIDRALVPRS